MSNRKKWIISLFSIIILIAASLGGCAKSNTSNQSNMSEPIIEDYSQYFKGMKGTAVFFNGDTNKYYIYNNELADMQTAPNSSFKIISCLMGLESGIIKPSDSTMKWDGTEYPITEWNKDLEYKEAFKVSAIWYYREVLDLVGQDYVQETLNNLSYGNCDISQWEGSLNNNVFPQIKSLKSINGFWQESTLKISPIQQTEVMYKIFHDKDTFSEQNIDRLKEIMLIDNDSNKTKIYGKTGTGIMDESWVDAWFVGFFEYDNETIYFSVRLNEPNTTGQNAKEIAIDIINNEFAN